MQYHDGAVVELDDTVSLAGKIGRVVCIFGSGLYGDGYSEPDWRHLKTGVLIDFEVFGPIHYEGGPKEDICFVARRT